MSAARVLKPETCAADCADWIKASHLAAYARGALDLAVMSSMPLHGEPFVVDGMGASSRATLAEFLVDAFRTMVFAHAERAGLWPGSQFTEELQRWQSGVQAAASITDLAESGNV